MAADCVVAVAPWDPTVGPPVHTQYPLIMVHTTRGLVFDGDRGRALKFQEQGSQVSSAPPRYSHGGASTLACYFVLWTADQSYDTSIVRYAGLEDQSMVHPGNSQGPWGLSTSLTSA